MKRITIISTKRGKAINRHRMEKAYRHVFKGPMDAHFYGSMVEIHVPANQQLDKKMAKKFARRLGGYKECQEEIRFCYNNGCAMSDVNVNFTFKY